MSDYWIDKLRTQSYKSIYTQACTCDNCENFRKAFTILYPNTNRRLNDMGIDINRALEIIDYWCEDSNMDKHPYSVFFSVAGSLKYDETDISDNEVKLVMYKADTDKPIYANTDMEKPYFILKLEVELPWVLNS